MKLHHLEIKTSADTRSFNRKFAGKVFHLTTCGAAREILKSKKLIANPHHMITTSPFGNYTLSTFRHLNCVSFFDYRKYGYFNWRRQRNKCRPLDVFNKVDVICVFVLRKNQYEKLISVNYLDHIPYTQMVPFIEVGYKEYVELNHISDLYFVTARQEIAENAFAKALKKRSF